VMRCVYEACIVSCGVCQSRESRVQRLVEEDVEAGERIRGRLCMYRVVALFRFMYNLEQREDYFMSIYVYDGCAGLVRWPVDVLVVVEPRSPNTEDEIDEQMMG